LLLSTQSTLIYLRQLLQFSDRATGHLGLGLILFSVSCFLLASCSSAIVSRYSEKFAHIDKHLRNADTLSAHQALDEISQHGTIKERAQAGLMRCELQSLEESPGFSKIGLCYHGYARSLEPEIKHPEVADFYALGMYRFYIEEPLGRRLLGLMKLSLQCPGTPAGLKAINYLKGYWGDFSAEQRMKAWQGWDQRVHQEKVAKCSPDPQSTQILAIVALERARAYLDLERPADALRVFESVWPTLGESVWWDDIAIIRADAFHKAGNADKALEVLQIFIDRRETSFFIGSYESIFFDEALMMRGKILNSVGKSQEARGAYLQLISTAPGSRLCDDAAYQAALLAKGTRKSEELQRFLEDYPESRWARKARAAMKP
jgi:tetratricopeptide (TPR) repeat protein